MPVLIILGILSVYFVAHIYEWLTTNTHAFTKDELEKMNKEMVGKSQQECRQIIRRYSQSRLDYIFKRK